MAYVTPGTVAAGDVATAAAWNVITNDVIDVDSRITQIKRLGYVERTTQSDSSASTFAAGTNLFATDITFTADGTSAYRIEFFGGPGDTQAGGRDIYLALSVSGTETGRFHIFDVSSRLGVQIACVRYLTPTAGSKTINFRHLSGGTLTTIRSGNGTGTNQFPMFMAVYGPDLT